MNLTTNKNSNKFHDNISLIKDNIKYQDQQLDELEKGIDKLEYSAETINNELSNQNQMINSLDLTIQSNIPDTNSLAKKVKKLYEKKSCWILTIGILVPLLIIIILVAIYS